MGTYRDLDHLYGVWSRRELLGKGVSYDRISGRLRTRRWQEPLPGVIVTHGGPLDEYGRRVVALRYAGRGAVLSHRTAAALLGLRVPEDLVDVTVPHGRRRISVAFVRTHQSRRGGARCRRQGLWCTSAARTVVDVAGTMRELDDVRALVADAVQRGLTTVGSIGLELRQAPRRGSALSRRAFDEVATGARSAGEARFLELARTAGLPPCTPNARVHAGGRWFRVDALWEAERLVVEIDGQAWHLGAAAWEQDLRRQNLLIAAGYTVLRFPVRRLRDDPAGVIAEVAAALANLHCGQLVS